MIHVKLILLRGLQGSGKSTWAAEKIAADQTFKRVSKDCLRDMLDNGVYSPDNEQNVCQVRDAIVESMLRRGLNVIVDDTNLNPAHVEALQFMAAQITNSGVFRTVDCQIRDFLHVPLEECIRRDARRPKPVGAAVIRRTWERWIKTLPTVRTGAEC